MAWTGGWGVLTHLTLLSLPLFVWVGLSCHIQASWPVWSRNPRLLLQHWLLLLGDVESIFYIYYQHITLKTMITSFRYWYTRELLMCGFGESLSTSQSRCSTDVLLLQQRNKEAMWSKRVKRAQLAYFGEFLWWYETHNSHIIQHWFI